MVSSYFQTWSHLSTTFGGDDQVYEACAGFSAFTSLVVVGTIGIGVAQYDSTLASQTIAGHPAGDNTSSWPAKDAFEPIAADAGEEGEPGVPLFLPN